METETSKTTSKAPHSDTTPKKPYHRPEILFQSPLEAMADVCDPLQGGKASNLCVLGES